jgi:hypothetical protein
MADEVVIRVRTEDTDEAAASIKPVTDAIASIGTGAVAVTGNMDLLNQKIAEIRASGAAIDDQVAKLTALRDETQIAADAFVAMGGSGSTAATAFGAAVDRLNGELGTTGDAGGAAVDSVAQKIGIAGQAADKFADTVEKGSPRILQAYNRLFLQQQGLRLEIEKTYGSIANAPPEVQQAYTKLGQQVDAARLKTRELRFELQEQNRELSIGGYRFSTMTQAIQDMLGPMGSVVTTAASVIAAFESGWAIGTKIGDMFGTDREAMKGFGADVKEWGAEFQNQMDIALGSAINLRDAFLSMDSSRIAQSQRDLNQSLEDMIRALISSKPVMDGYRAAEDVGIQVTEQWTGANEDLTRAGELQAKAFSLGSLGIKLWVAAAKEAKSQGAEGAQLFSLWLSNLERLNPRLDELAKRIDAETKVIVEEERERKKAIDLLQSQIDGLDKMITTIDRETTSYGTAAAAREHLMATQQKLAAELSKFEPAVNGSTAALDAELKVLKNMTAQYDAYEPAIKATIPVLQASLDATIKLTAGQRLHFQSMIDEVTEIGRLEAANKSLTTQLNAQHKVFDQMTAAEVETRKAQELAVWENEQEIASKKAAVEATLQVTAGVKESATWIAAGTAATAGGSTATDTYTGKLREHAGVITIVGGAAHEAAGKLGDMATKAAAAGLAFDGSTAQILADAKKQAEAMEPIKKSLDELDASYKAEGASLKNEILPQLAAQRAEYAKLDTAAEQHAEAVKLIGQAWIENAKRAAEYHTTIDGLPGAGKGATAAPAPAVGPSPV